MNKKNKNKIDALTIVFIVIAVVLIFITIKKINDNKKQKYVENEIKTYFAKKYNVNKNDIDINDIDFYEGKKGLCIDTCPSRHFEAIIKYNGQKYSISNNVKDANYTPDQNEWNIMCDEKDECIINGKIID